MRHIQHGFLLQENQGVKYLTIPSFNEAGGVICALSTRVGGVSEKPYNTLNFSRKRERSTTNFRENFRRFSAAVGFDMQAAVAINYAHSAALYRADKKDAGCGVTKDSVPIVCDGLYTDIRELPLISYHADCVPLYFYDPKRRAVALCHAGWRGVSAHMAQNAVNALVSIGASAGNILAAVGPCISAENFEVDTDVGDLFIREFGKETVSARGKKVCVDLPEACVRDMTAAGIAPEHITVSGLCTFNQTELFFSHRRDKGKTGAMAAVIVMVEPK